MGLRSFLLLSLFLVACMPESENLSLPSQTAVEEKTKNYFLERRKKDPDRASVLEALYQKGKICQKEPQCETICKELFDLEYARNTCFLIPESDVYQIERLFTPLKQGDFSTLKDFSAFYLKIFLSITPRQFYLFVKSRDDFEREELLFWIAEDVSVGQIVLEEDWDFLILESFFSSNQIFPLELSVKDPDGFSFAEKAWINQNEQALHWIHGFFAKSMCKGQGQECLMKQYCHLIQDFHPNILEDFKTFEPLSELLQGKKDISCQTIL